MGGGKRRREEGREGGRGEREGGRKMEWEVEVGKEVKRNVEWEVEGFEKNSISRWK